MQKKFSMLVREDKYFITEYVLRGVKVHQSGRKEVVIEEVHENMPTESEIIDFLTAYRDKVDFCSIAENYSIADVEE